MVWRVGEYLVHDFHDREDPSLSFLGRAGVPTSKSLPRLEPLKEKRTPRGGFLTTVWVVITLLLVRLTSRLTSDMS